MTTQNDTNWQVILNPHAGSGKGQRDKRKIMYVLELSGINFHIYTSEYPGHILQIAKQLVNEGADHFIVAGGDGSLNELVNGIFNGDPSISDKFTVGVLPVGTGNDWIKTFGIPDDYTAAMNIIKKGKTVFQDVGEISFSNNGTTHKRYFVNIFGFGFDAMVATKANDLKNKGVKGFRVYVQSLISSFLKFRTQMTDILIDKENHRVNLFSASIGIGKYNGGGMMQVPDANPVKGDFHITIIRQIGIWGILKNFKGLYSGKFISDYRVSTHIGKHISIKSATLLPGEADGESLGNARFEVTIIPHKLRVIYGDDVFFK